ncbi:hypothetical protein, partial [Vibrio parahaemolyticus]|uniref:hypothetical protein n=1 Tax=Vibrio parahaemolyticus TaxID=670 RepID=UPI001F2B4C8A
LHLSKMINFNDSFKKSLMKVIESHPTPFQPKGKPYHLSSFFFTPKPTQENQHHTQLRLFHKK